LRTSRVKDGGAYPRCRMGRCTVLSAPIGVMEVWSKTALVLSIHVDASSQPASVEERSN
jgi:hypothetical protein